MKGVNYCTCL